MEDVDFVCTSKDCSQKVFVDEKQLISHRRKHDMVLTLNKASHFSSDETPTPTRFIRNCEAIGLFQDLQVNPFDETFKKAAEAARKGELPRLPAISTLGKPAGEDLHTPHIDLTHDAHPSNIGVEDEMETVIRTEADTSLRINSTSNPKTSIPGSSEVNRDKPKTPDPDFRLFVKMPDGTLVQIPTIGGHPAIGNGVSITSPRTIIISTENIKKDTVSQKVVVPTKSNKKPQPIPANNNSASAAVKQKLKAALLKTSKESGSPKSSVQVLSSPLITINTSGSESSVNEIRKEKRVSSTTTEEDHERKLKTLERNRIAAMRCRQKRKKFINDLREKYTKVCAVNENLVKEVTYLRAEVVRLKNALLVAYNQPHFVEDVTATSVEIVAEKMLPSEKDSLCEEQMRADPMLNRVTGSLTKGLSGTHLQSDPLLSSSARPSRGGLKLDIEGATSVTVMDLDSPLVMRDEVLSSVAPPTTPNDKLIAFPELDRVDGEAEKMLSSVIQINPNALSKLSSAFS